MYYMAQEYITWYRVILLGMELSYFAWHRNMLDGPVMFGITHNAQYFSAWPISMSQYIAQDYLSVAHDYVRSTGLLGMAHDYVRSIGLLSMANDYVRSTGL